MVSLFVKGLGGGTLTCPFPDMMTSKLESSVEKTDDAVEISERPSFRRAAATTVTTNVSAMIIY